MAEDQAVDTEPAAEEDRCKPHGTRLPCPRCLAFEYGVPVWNNL